MMSPVVGRGEYRAAAAAISAGHAEYPSFRHLFPDPARRTDPRCGPSSKERYAMRSRSVPCSRLAMEAGWMQPAVSAPARGLPLGSALRKLRATPSLALRSSSPTPVRSLPLPAMAAHVERHHRGNERLGIWKCSPCVPSASDAALGTRLLEPILARADRDGVSCRLETSDPANVAYRTSGSVSMSTVHRSRSSATAPL